MQGGDLNNALKELSIAPLLTWYNHGAKIALDIIKGLQFLHSHNVSLGSALLACYLCSILHQPLHTWQHAMQQGFLDASPAPTKQWLPIIQ